MAVPLLPVLTNAGSRLIRGDRLVWAVFFIEWTVLVFERWVADAFHRGLLWRLPPRVLNGIRDLGYGVLLRSTAYIVKDVEFLLEIHGGVDWEHRSPASARVGAVPVTRDVNAFTTVRESDLSRVQYRQMEQEETVVAEGRWDNEIGLVDRAPRGTHLRSAAIPESRLSTFESLPRMGSDVCSLDPPSHQRTDAKVSGPWTWQPLLLPRGAWGLWRRTWVRAHRRFMRLLRGGDWQLPHLRKTLLGRAR
jgi:hypothetical protein